MAKWVISYARGQTYTFGGKMGNFLRKVILKPNEAILNLHIGSNIHFWGKMGNFLHKVILKPNEALHPKQSEGGLY